MRLTCRDCGVEREADQFYKNKNYKCGYATNTCRPCRVEYRKRNRIRDSAYMKVWREANPAYIRAYNARHYAKNKVENDARVKLWRRENPAKASEIEKRKYFKAKANGTWRPRRNAVSRRLYHTSPIYAWKRAARAYVKACVMNGIIKQLPCERCGDPKVEGHHYKGYEERHWLDVQWLCRKHHKEAHGCNHWGT